MQSGRKLTELLPSARIFDGSQIPSTCLTAGRPSVKFLYNPTTFRNLPSTFGAAERTSVNFRYHSVQQGELLSIFVNFACGKETFRQLLLSYRASGGTSVNFCQLSVWPGYLLSTPTNFLCGWVTFHQFLSTSSAKKDLLSNSSTFRAKRRLSVKFRQLFEWPANLPRTSVNFLRGRETFHLLP